MTGAGAGLVGAGLRRVFLRDMMVMASIGVERREQGVRQRVRINVELGVAEAPDAGVGADRLDRVVDYAAVAEAVRRIVAEGHVKLVETLGERIAAACLVDERVAVARVRVEKLDVFADIHSVGIEVERLQSSTRAG